MSKLFYDHLLELEELNNYINEVVDTGIERDELWQLVDEIIHHRVLGCVLDHLPTDHHESFVEKYKTEPHNNELIVFVNERIEHDIEEKIRENIKIMEEELLSELTR